MLDNLKDLVVKEVHGSGGYGMLIGPKSSKAEIEEYRKRIVADPADSLPSRRSIFRPRRRCRMTALPVGMSIFARFALSANPSAWCRAG